MPPHPPTHDNYPAELPPDAVSAEQLFAGFTWKEGAAPTSLIINAAGFPEDPEGNWYLSRKARNRVGLDVIQPDDLYNGPQARHWNSTEGSGLYFTNHPNAAKKLPIGVVPAHEPKELYICRIKPDSKTTLNVTDSLHSRAIGQQAAAVLLRARSVVPGIPSPTRTVYDRLYGDATVVITPPLAVARLVSGRSPDIAGKPLQPRWAIVRDTSLVEPVAYRHIE